MVFWFNFSVCNFAIGFWCHKLLFRWCYKEWEALRTGIRAVAALHRQIVWIWSITLFVFIKWYWVYFFHNYVSFIFSYPIFLFWLALVRSFGYVWVDFGNEIIFWSLNVKWRYFFIMWSCNVINVVISYVQNYLNAYVVVELWYVCLQRCFWIMLLVEWIYFSSNYSDCCAE